MFGPPSLVVAVRRMSFRPGSHESLRTVAYIHLFHDVVVLKLRVPTSTPFISTVHGLGRWFDAPFAYRNERVHGPPEPPSRL